jgi:uncharacterized protein YicC (UPF0701 family)
MMWWHNRLQDELPQTPVTAEALASLRSRIEEDAHALDETSRKRLQKLANAAQVSFAECALLQDENRLLFKQNNEAKRRRSAKSTVVGKAKVMSYEDIERREGSVLRRKLQKRLQRLQESVVAVESGKAPRRQQERRSEMEAAEDEIAALGLRNHCSVLQFPSESNGARQA